MKKLYQALIILNDVADSRHTQTWVSSQKLRLAERDLARMRQDPLWQGRPCRRARGRRADKQRTGSALRYGPSAQRGRRSAGGSGPRGRRSSRACSGAGLPLPAPPGRSRVRAPKCDAPPRTAAKGVGGAFGTWEAWQKEQQPSHPQRARLLERWLSHGRSWRSGNGRVGRGTRRRRSLRSRARHGLGAGEHALPASAGQGGRGRAGRSAPALHAALRQQHFKPPPSLASESAQTNHTPRPFSWT